MKTKTFCLMMICLMFVGSLYSQSKKKIREHKIISETTYNLKIIDGKEVSIKDSYEVYDKNGNVIEQTEYNKEGAIKKTEKTVYNANKDKIEEATYDGSGNLKSKKAYTYNSSGEKIGEIEYDGNGSIIKQSLTLFDTQGFKTGKRTYDGNKKLISTKKYVYNQR